MDQMVESRTAGMPPGCIYIYVSILMLRILVTLLLLSMYFYKLYDG